MTKFAKFAADGSVVTFYVAGLHPEIPADAVAVSEDQWMAHIGGTMLLSRAPDGTISAAPPAAPDPADILAQRRAGMRCSKLQAKRVLNPIGLWGEFKAIVAADPDMLEDWDLAYEIYRTDPMIAAAAGALSVPLTAEALDVLFDLAVQTPAPADAEIIAAFQAVQTQS